MLFRKSDEVGIEAIVREPNSLLVRAFHSKKSAAQPCSQFIFSKVSPENQPTAGGNYGDESRPD
jgi:hypothetical protein